MKGRLFCLRDKVSGRYSHFAVMENEAMYIREMVVHRVAFPMNFDDYEVVSLGSFEAILRDSSVEKFPWSAWRYPESKADLLAPLGLTNEEYSEIINNKTLKGDVVNAN